MTGPSETGFLGHTAIVNRFRDCIGRGRLGSSYLFVGPPGVGKRTFALRLAQGLLCEKEEERGPVAPCQVCPTCAQVAAEAHPDVMVVARPRDRAFIPLELLIGDREHRASEGFCHWVAMTPFSGRFKVGVIDDADYLNPEGANCLLKTLEEPPSRSILILIATSEHRQLPTIRSRCQIIRFGGLSEVDLATLLLRHGHCADADQAHQAATAANGSLDTALHACDPDWSTMRDRVWQGLAGLPAARWDLVELIQQYLDASGSETSEKRHVMRTVLLWSIQYWRSALRFHEGSLPDDTPVPLAELLRRSASAAPGCDHLADCLERSLDGVAQVDNNVILAEFIDAWVDDLANARTGEG